MMARTPFTTHLRNLAPVWIFLLAGLFFVPQYGFFGDEIWSTTMVRDNINVIGDYLKGDFSYPYIKIISSEAYYGTLFNLLGYIVQYPFIAKYGLLSPQSLLAKQYLVFVFSMIAYISLYLALYHLHSSRWSASLALGTLVIQPLFLSHAFANSKDIPFACLFTLSSVSCGYAVSQLVALMERAKNDPQAMRQTYRWSVLQGAIIGAVACVRIGGVIALAFFMLILALAIFSRRKHREFHPWIYLAKCGGISFAAIFLMLWALHPVSYFTPVSWMLDSLFYHAAHPHETAFLTNGEWLKSTETPWYYMPTWVGAQTPLLIQLLTVSGCVLFFRTLHQRDLAANATGVAFFLQLTFIPLFAMTGHMHLYSGMRHFLFMCPAMAYFSSLSLMTLGRYFPNRRSAQCLCVCIALLTGKLTYELISLHPYEMDYFIEPLRSDPMQKRWWLGGGIKEGMEWLNEHTPDNKPTVVFYDRYISGGVYEGLKKSTLEMKDTHQFEDLSPFRPYYIIRTNRHPFAIPMDDHCQREFTIDRTLGSTPLQILSIWYCP